MGKKCPQCKNALKNVVFDVGYGVKVDSLHCERCGFNITDDNVLKKAIFALKENIAKEVKVIKVGTGLGLRFPNEIVKGFGIKRGEEVLLKPEEGGIKVVIS